MSLNTFQQLQELPMQFNYYMPKPLMYPEDSNCLIISSDSEEATAGIFKYNLTNNAIHSLHKYDNSITADLHGHFIDGDLLCVFGGKSDSFLIYDLNTNTNITNKYINHCIFALKTADACPKTEATHNCINIFQCEGSHIKYDCDKQKLIYLSKDNVKLQVTYPKLTYVSALQQLKILGSDDSDAILTYNSDKQCWQMNEKIKMPYVVTNDISYDVLSFGDVIIVFYFGSSGHYDIWCLDLLCSKWFKSDHSVPISVKYLAYCIKSINNYVHLLNFEQKTHFKLNIFELFSRDMIISRRKIYQPLVMEYVRQQENNGFVSSMPFVLKQLILCYFQLFG
eukprot:259894_1